MRHINPRGLVWCAIPARLKKKKILWPHDGKIDPRACEPEWQLTSTSHSCCSHWYMNQWFLFKEKPWIHQWTNTPRMQRAREDNKWFRVKVPNHWATDCDEPWIFHQNIYVIIIQSTELYLNTLIPRKTNILLQSLSPLRNYEENIENRNSCAITVLLL